MSHLSAETINKAHQAFLDALTEPIINHAKRFITHVMIKDLKQWPIRQYALDLDQGSTFQRPSLLHGILDRAEPRFKDCFSVIDIAKEKFDSRIRASFMFLQFYEEYLLGPIYHHSLLHTRTGWRRNEFADDEGEDDEKNQPLLYSFTQWPDSYMNHAFLFGFAVPRAELLDGCLTIDELDIIVRWAEVHIKDLMQREMRAMSITLLSAWGAKARIVAAEVNFDPPVLTLGISPLMKTPDTLHLDDPATRQLLFWGLSKANGDLEDYTLGVEGPSLFHKRPSFPVQSCSLPTTSSPMAPPLAPYSPPSRPPQYKDSATNT